MDHNPDRLCVWPGYFDLKSSRRSGRRVPKDAAVLKPDLDGLFMAARSIGLRKIKREEHTSHPRRPHGREGRLWVSSSGAKDSIFAHHHTLKYLQISFLLYCLGPQMNIQHIHRSLIE